MPYITLENVSIVFAIYNSKTRSIRHSLLSKIGGNVKDVDGTSYVQALDNITCSISKGERIGLIGHNGAGKSTFLKLISGVYSPTNGKITTKGKISSMNDITMGMDAELSGYDNIIMRCIFMGMSFKETHEILPTIVEFSELEEYISLPLRTYSTGMYMRLAFSIATAVIPEILVMDEMIATGDKSFLAKTQNRMNELISAAQIMVLSSHDLGLMSNMCTRGIWLEKGRVKMDDAINKVISKYQEYVEAN